MMPCRCRDNSGVSLAMRFKWFKLVRQWGRDWRKGYEHYACARGILYALLLSLKCGSTSHITASYGLTLTLVHTVQLSVTCWRPLCSLCPVADTGPVWARERCRISPPRFLAECCKRQLNQGSFVLLYFRLFTFSDLYWLCLSVFSCTVLFVSISQVIGCEDRLWNDLYCVEWGVKLYSNQPMLTQQHSRIVNIIVTLVHRIWPELES